MPNEKTNADSLRLYLTGALSVGAAQPFHSLSLGGLRSSEELGLGHELRNSIPGLVVDFVSVPNGIGAGALAVISASSISWTPPAGAQGAAVTIANGETKILEGDAVNKYIRVTRNSATDLGGTATVVTKRCWGSAIVGRDATVAGLTTYSGLIFKNESGSEITNLVVWFSADTEARAWVAQEAVVSDAITDISIEGDESAPDGVSGWNQGTTSGTGLNIGTVAAGASVGLWLRRIVPGAVDATPKQVQSISYQFDVGGETYIGGATGFYRVSDTSLENLLIYRGVGAEPDFTAPPFEISSITIDAEGRVHVDSHQTAALPPDATYFFVSRVRDKFGLISQNIDSTRIEIDAGGDEVEVPPAAPEEPTLEPGAAGIVTVGAFYQSFLDGDNAADTWLIYLTDDGSTPDPDADTPIEVEMVDAGGLARLDYDSDAFSDGATIKVIVRTRRTDAADSTNTNVLTTTASTSGSTAIEAGACWGLSRAEETIIRVWTGDANNYIDVIKETGAFRFVIGGAAVAGITASGFLGRAGATSTAPYVFDLPQDDQIELDAGSGAIGFAAGPEGARFRMMEISPAGDLRVSSIVIEAGYPFAEVNDDYITWDDPDLDFSGDKANVIMRLTQVDVGGNVNGELHVKGVRDI